MNSADQALARAAVAAGREAEALWGGPGADPDGSAPDQANATALFHAFALAVAAVDSAADPDLRRLARLAQGVRDDISLRALIAILTPFERWTERPLRDEEFLVAEGDARAAIAPARPLVAILDNLRSAFNVGAIFRAAECAGCESAILTGYTPGPSRTAMGTDLILPWKARARLGSAVPELRAAGFQIVALETSARAVDLYEIAWPEKCALLLGNERFGLGAEALREADLVCRIPMLGSKNSLNVGAAFAVAAFEFRRATEPR